MQHGTDQHGKNKKYKFLNSHEFNNENLDFSEFKI